MKSPSGFQVCWNLPFLRLKGCTGLAFIEKAHGLPGWSTPIRNRVTLAQLSIPDIAPNALLTPGYWLLPSINGSMMLGLLFGQLFRHLPGRSAWVKGGVFGILSWLLLGLGLFPLAGIGIFASRLALGAMPALLMLAMLMAYAITVSVLYGWLTHPYEKHRPRT